MRLKQPKKYIHAYTKSVQVIVLVCVDCVWVGECVCVCVFVFVRVYVKLQPRNHFLKFIDFSGVCFLVFVRVCVCVFVCVHFSVFSFETPKNDKIQLTFLRVFMTCFVK